MSRDAWICEVCERRYGVPIRRCVCGGVCAKEQRPHAPLPVPEGPRRAAQEEYENVESKMNPDGVGILLGDDGSVKVLAYEYSSEWETLPEDARAGVEATLWVALKENSRLWLKDPERHKGELSDELIEAMRKP